MPVRCWAWSSCQPIARQRRCAGWSRSQTCCKTAGSANQAASAFTPDLIEAWAATGQLDRAASRLAWLQQAARRLDHPWARITAGRAEAALRLAQRNPTAAIRAVAAVIPEARERGLPFELGRCLLVLGTAQRKARHRRDAAATLDEAAATFASLGAQRWQALAGAQRGRLIARTRQHAHAHRAADRRPCGRRAQQP